MSPSSRWHPGRLLVGWALGVLTTIGLVALVGGWYEYRLLSTAPGSGSPARRVAATDSACQVDREGAINVGGFEVVPRQDDPCYLRRPRIRPWQWADGIKELLGRLSGAASATPPTSVASPGTTPAAVSVARLGEQAQRLGKSEGDGGRPEADGTKGSTLRSTRACG